MNSHLSSLRQTILFHPSFKDKEKILDEIIRLVWYLESVYEHVDEVYFYLENMELDTTTLETLMQAPDSWVNDLYDPIIKTYMPKWCGKIRVIPDPKNILLRSNKIRFDWIALHERDSVQCPNDIDTYIDEKHRKDTCNGVCIDTRNDPLEANNRSLMGWYITPPEERERALQKSEENLQKLKTRIQTKDPLVHLFGSGLSVQYLSDTDYHYDAGMNIICNSLIYDEPLMKRIKPDVVIGMDPVHHTGPIAVAARYRNRLNDFMKEYPACYLATMYWNYSCFKQALSPEFHSRIILLNLAEAAYNLDLTQNNAVFPTENVLTYAMIPFACTFSKHIRIIGCDGRPFLQETHIWSYNKTISAAEGDKNNGVDILHPAFASIKDPTYYFLTHCKELEKILSYAEENGHIFETIMPTYIPPLAKRYKDVL